MALTSREVSANLDFMAEARRRPRPGALHPTATDERDDVGLQGEFVEAEDIDAIHDPEADVFEGTSTTLRPDIQYKPILQVASNDLFDVVHRRDGIASGPGRVGASTKRSREFLHQYGEKYLEMKEPRSCVRPGDVDLRRCDRFNVVSGLKAQKTLQESRKEKEEQMMDASDEELMPGDAGIVDLPVDIAPEVFVSSLSPAEVALRLVQQRLPTLQPNGDYEISKDQYNACVLAVAPLQRLWNKAGEQDLQSCFGVRGRLHEVLALVTPAPWRACNLCLVWSRALLVLLLVLVSVCKRVVRSLVS